MIRQVAPDRYDMHQLLRQFSTEKLQSMPMICDAVQMEHARYFTAFLGRQRSRLKTAEQRQALEEIEPEIENCRLAWNVAVLHRWPEQVELSLDGFCQYYSVRGRFQEGMDLLQRAIDVWRDVPQQRRVFGVLLARQAVLCAKLGYLDRAEPALRESLAISRQLDLVSEQVYCLLRLSDVLCQRGVYDQAVLLASESLTLSRQIEDRWSIARALDLIAIVHYRKGDIDQAERECEESLVISRQIGHHQLMLRSLNKLADITCHRGDYDRAARLYDECITLARALGDAYNEAIHLNNQGTVFYGLEEYEQAEGLFLSSLKICRQISDRVGEAMALSNLGEVAHDLGRYDQALVYNQEALAIGRETEHQWTLMSCLRNLGRTACAIDDDGAARAYLSEALEVAYNTQTTTMSTEILTYLGLYFAKSGQRGRAAELLTLTSQHPACYLDMKNYAGRLLAEFDLAPPEGEPRPLEVVAAEVLAELAS
jgi:tetratricopeptide (TPR) repeat protein